MKESPPLGMLSRIIVADNARELPLHAQVRRALKIAIDEHFDDGQQFWTENALVTQLGLSQITVRRALQDLSREGVLERRRALGSFVRKEKKKAVDSVGVFLPAYDSTFQASMLDHWASLLRPTQRRLHVYHTHRGETTAEAYGHLQGTPETEGIILFSNSPQVTQELFGVLNERGFRVVNVDTAMPQTLSPFVGVDNALGIRMALEHLYSLGHRHIVLFVKEPEDVESVQQRIRTFEQVTREMHIQGRVASCGHNFYKTGEFSVEQIMTELWSMPERPTAILGVSDPSVWPILRWCAQNGVRVPDELSVMGFDDDRPSQYMNPALTTLAQPLEAIARRALAFLDEGWGGLPEFLPPSLVLRESTAPPDQRQ